MASRGSLFDGFAGARLEETPDPSKNPTKSKQNLSKSFVFDFLNAKVAKEQRFKILSIRRERRRTKGFASFSSLRGREDLNPLHQPLRTLPTAKTRVALRWPLLKLVFFAPLRPLRTKHKNIRNPSVAVSLKIRIIRIIRCVKKTIGCANTAHCVKVSMKSYVFTLFRRRCGWHLPPPASPLQGAGAWGWRRAYRARSAWESDGCERAVPPDRGRPDRPSRRGWPA